MPKPFGATLGGGAQFLPTGAVIGPPVPIIPTSDRPGAAPVRWVSAEDLSNWANRTDGAVSLPTLLAYLIKATHGFGSSTSLSRPTRASASGLGRAHLGPRPRVLTCPEGRSRAGKSVPSAATSVIKASDDYRKRTADPAPLDSGQRRLIYSSRHATGRRKTNGPRRAETKAPWRGVPCLRRRRPGPLDRADPRCRALASSPPGQASGLLPGTLPGTIKEAELANEI